MTALGDAYTNLLFWQQIRGDAARTLLCEPQHLAGLQAAVEARGLDNIITVRASTACPEGKILILDEAAVEASHRQVMQQAARGIRFGFGG